MMKRLFYSIIFGLFCISLLGSCNEYLNVKPERSLAVPHTLADLRAILDNETRINDNFPVAGDIASNYYNLSDADWQALNENTRNTYLWNDEANTDADWKSCYLKVLDANVVLDHIENAETGNLKESNRAWIKGNALFIRGWTFYHIAQIYAPPFDTENASDLPGIPLKLVSDINETIKRATLKETYQQIIKDLEMAADLLPVTTPVATRPNKSAAYAALSRVALVMGNYEMARDYSTASLEHYQTLIDYNTLDTNASKPVEVLNDEVLFHCLIANGGGVFSNSRAAIDSVWVSNYSNDDLRKKIFFIRNSDGTYGFKGDYGRHVLIPFGGLATDEVYLTRAEAFARLGDVEASLRDLDALLIKRWKAGTYIPQTAATPEHALRLIIEERRKELICRGGIYWNDLRRLNKDTRFAQTLERTINGQVFRLTPFDKRYTFLIPNSVIDHSGIQQNER